MRRRSLIGRLLAGGLPSHRLLRLLGCLLLLALSSRSGAAQTAPSRLLVRDITPGPRSTDVFSPTVVGAQAFFLTQKPLQQPGRDLWVTDGSLDGTRRITDLIAPGADPAFDDFIAFQNRLLLQVIVNGQLQLWQSDGTPAGTRLIAAVDDLGFKGVPVIMDGAAYFFTIGAVTPSDEVIFHLWRSAGTAATTKRIAATQPFPRNSTATLLVAGSRLYAEWRNYGVGVAFPTNAYAAFDGSQFTPLGACVGSQYDAYCATAGPWNDQLVVARNTPTQLQFVQGTVTRTLDLTTLPIGHIKTLSHIGPTLIFSAVNADREQWLWRSDGTLAGTQPLRRFDGTAEPYQNHLYWFFAAHDLLYFYEHNPAFVPTRLWRTDGTVAGTQPIVGHAGRYSTLLIPTLVHGVVDDRVIFAADDGIHGAELWQIASRDAPPRLLADLYPGPGGSSAMEIFPALPDGMLWLANDGVVGSELRYLADFAPYVQPAWGGGPAGGLATAPVRFGNDGPDSRPVTVTLTLPAGVSLVRQTVGAHPITTTGRVEWRLDSLPTGERQALLTVQLPAAPLGSVFTGTLSLEPGGSAPIRFQIARHLYLDRVSGATPSSTVPVGPAR